MDKKDVGILMNPQAMKLHRTYFQQMCQMIGMNFIHRAPREDKHYNGYGELDSFYYEPEIVSGIFEEHPNIWTMKKLGWNSELQEDNSLIQVPYDTKGLQVGSLFIIPSGLDNTKGRLFKVIEMSATSIYPSSVVCKIGPVYKSKFEKSDLDPKNNNFTLLKSEDEEE